MENPESTLKNAPYFHCEKGTDSIPLCQKCETCVLAWKIFSTKEWFCRINDISQRRFLVSILKQLNSLYLLHYFQNILQTTQGKDFIYNRSRIDLSKKEGKVAKSFLNQMLDKTVEQKMKEILYWFGNSTHWTKANYTLLLLQMCNPKLLLTAANVIRVLFLREQNSISGLNQDITGVCFSPEKDDSSKSATSQVYWTAKTQHTSLPLSKAPENEHLLGAASNPEEPWRNSLQCISEMNRLFSEKGGITKPGYDPCSLLVDLDDIRDLSSGFSKYRDFIRYLPIHLSKYILRMLDRHTLNKCASVSQHWAAMAQQVKTDLSAHAFIQNQIIFMQGSYTRGIDPNYANKVSIPVPKMVDDGNLMEILSKSNMQLHSPRESVSSKQTVIQELLPSKPPKSRVLLKPAKFSSEADDVEKAQKQGQLETPEKLLNHPKKKSWKIPMSPDQFLLTVSALQQAHNSGKFAYPCRPRTEIIDVWGPSILYPRKVLNFKGKSIQHAVDRLRLSNPPIDVKQTSIPLEIQKLQPNLKISLHSPRVQSTLPQPMIIRSRFSGSLKGGDQVTSSIERAVCSPLTSMQVIKPNRMLAPQVGTATLSLNKERPRIYTALDPLRVNTEFVLLTVKEEKEHQEAKMEEYQARESTGVVDPGKASKAAWIRKIKGLPIDNFMKQGKTAAPELGQNVFI
uniref:F-box domain-containing protein n=1 Tax=Colobus angolensis palliatus TaxID=336983 RepID=A0A2K5JH51_COLAP